MVIDGVKSTQLNINELYLDVCVAITNAQLPTTIDKGVVLQKMENASDAVNINYVCDDKIINFPALKNMKAELLEEAIDGIDLSDTQTKRMLECAKWCWKDIDYNYINKRTKDTVKIVLTNDQISSILRNN